MLVPHPTNATNEIKRLVDSENLLLGGHYRSLTCLRVVLPFHSVGHGGQFGEEAFGDEFLQTGRRLAARGFELVDGAVHLQ